MTNNTSTLIFGLILIFYGIHVVRTEHISIRMGGRGFAFGEDNNIDIEGLPARIVGVGSIIFGIICELSLLKLK